MRGKQTKRCRTTSCDVARNSLSILFQKHRPVQSINQSQVSGNVEDQSQVLGNFEEGGGGGAQKSLTRTEPPKHIDQDQTLQIMSTNYIDQASM